MVFLIFSFTLLFVGYIIAYIEPGGLVDRDSRFAIGDEIVNVNGQSLRGLEMEVARNVLRNISGKELANNDAT